MSRSKGFERGVTLVELLIVMVLLASTAALVAPAFSRGLDNFSLRSTGKRLAAEFRRAQLEARLSQNNIWVAFNEGRFAFHRGDAIERIFELPSGIEIVRQGIGESIVYTFLGSGQVVGPRRISLINTRGRTASLRLGGILDLVEYVEE
jgi:prepilin-type N-terminal cleavage/methylation domain-containing protein